MNRRQRVALGVGLALVLFNLVCPYTSFYPDPPLAQRSNSGISGFCSLYEEWTVEPTAGFRPIWLTPDPFFIDGVVHSFGYDTGVVWWVVVAIMFGVALLTLIAVTWSGSPDWRRMAADRTRRGLVLIRSRLRFSIRGLMLAVALVAVGIQAVRLAGLSLQYHRLAVSYAEGPRWPGAGRTLSEAEIKRRDDWWKNQERKYHRAALRPWASVEPDPPYPE